MVILGRGYFSLVITPLDRFLWIVHLQNHLYICLSLSLSLLLDATQRRLHGGRRSVWSLCGRVACSASWRGLKFTWSCGWKPDALCSNADVTHRSGGPVKFKAVFSFWTNLTVPRRKTCVLNLAPHPPPPHLHLHLLSPPHGASASSSALCEKGGMHNGAGRTLFRISTKLPLIIYTAAAKSGVRKFFSALSLQSAVVRGKEKRANQKDAWLLMHGRWVLHSKCSKFGRC